MKKLRHRENGIVLGFDECNNSLSLPVYNPNIPSSVIVVGYMTPDTGRANYGSEMYERKGGIFGEPKTGIKKALLKGRKYLSNHSSFLYTSIPENSIKSTPLCLLKGKAIVLLTLSFFLKYNLNPSKTQIVYDGIDRKVHTNHVEDVLEMWFEKAGLKIDFLPKSSADYNVPAVRKADVIAYYLSAITFLGNNSKWPYRIHKVGLNTLERLVIQFKERQDIDFY